MADLPDGLRRAETVAAVDHVIRSRSTRKVLGHPDAPQPLPESGFWRDVWQAVSVAGWAPFHYKADDVHRQGGLCSPVPWRFHVLDAAGCRGLCRRLLEMAQDPTADATWRGVPAGKIPPMLAAAGAMVLATWLPVSPAAGQDDPGTQDDQKTRLRDQEHLAAASAAVQNLLLAAEARGMATYWSSGGVLRTGRAFSLCGIDVGEQLLGAIFLFPAPVAEISWKPGALRNERGDVATWARQVAFSDDR